MIISIYIFIQYINLILNNVHILIKINIYYTIYNKIIAKINYISIKYVKFSSY